MKISVMLITSDFRGDHAADVFIAHELKPNETVKELVERLIKEDNLGGYSDHIELRVVNPPKD